MHADAISRTLYANERLLAGEFWCAPDSARWHSLNSVSPEPHVIFPRTPVTIRQLGRDPVVCDRNQIVFSAAFLLISRDPKVTTHAPPVRPRPSFGALLGARAASSAP